VVGGSWITDPATNSQVAHATIWNSGVPTDLGPGGAFGVNNAGQVVGRISGVPGGGWHAFLWSGGTMTDLNSVLDSSAIGWTLEGATAINASGQIAGIAINRSGQQEGFLLTPGPAESHQGNFTITGSTELELFGASISNVTFAAGDTGTLKLDSSFAFAGTVAGLAPGNYVDLADLAYQGNNAPVYNSTGTNTGTLAVAEGSSTVNIAMLGSYIAGSFVASSDGRGGTLVTDPVVVGPAVSL
jgi:probable HAF family extracellular repeat protein